MGSNVLIIHISSPGAVVSAVEAVGVAAAAVDVAAAVDAEGGVDVAAAVNRKSSYKKSRKMCETAIYQNDRKVERARKCVCYGSQNNCHQWYIGFISKTVWLFQKYKFIQ